MTSAIDSGSRSTSSSDRSRTMTLKRLEVILRAESGSSLRPSSVRRRSGSCRSTRCPFIAVKGQRVDLQEPDLRLTLLGRSDEPLSARNITSNRFSVIVRDLSDEDVERLPESIAEVMRVGVVNYFDSQRFGFVKHGQGF